MSEPFLSEIRIFGFNFAPRGWATCDGQILPINQNQSLYSLLGTTYGGDGRTSFALPDLRSRVPLHMGQGNGQHYTEGSKGGAETVTLTTNQLPSHTHTVNASGNPATTNDPTNNVFAVATDPRYGTPSAAEAVDMMNGTLTNAGGGQAHDNRQPYLTLNFCIALTGMFPSRN